MTTPSIPSLHLSTGESIPQIGLGVWQSPKGATTQQAVRAALRHQFCHAGIALQAPDVVGDGRAGIERPGDD